MSFEDTYWNTKNVAELYKAENPEQAIIQPLIAKHVMGKNPEHILDYGCGDAFLAKILPDTIGIDLYDRNQESLEQVFSSLDKENCKRLFSEDEFPTDYYDCIVLSFVLVCIDNLDDQIRIFKKLRKSLKKSSGTLIITNSHPCFIQYDFTAFETELNTKNFNYFNNGKPYQVSIKQPNGNDPITFVDYQWQLSVWINAAIDSGFTLQEMVEIPDEPYKDLDENKLYPPFLILKFN
ncbi:MAG: class I SAM-dependent methyltransferase [Balneola sp.]